MQAFLNDQLADTSEKGVKRLYKFLWEEGEKGVGSLSLKFPLVSFIRNELAKHIFSCSISNSSDVCSSSGAD